MVSQVVELVGLQGILTIALELRARIRCMLGLWAKAGEDVRVALKGLEEGDGGEFEDRNSDDERDEVSRHNCIVGIEGEGGDLGAHHDAGEYTRLRGPGVNLGANYDRPCQHTSFSCIVSLVRLSGLRAM